MMNKFVTYVEYNVKLIPHCTKDFFDFYLYVLRIRMCNPWANKTDLLLPVSAYISITYTARRSIPPTSI